MRETAYKILKMSKGILLITADEEGVTGVRFCGGEPEPELADKVRQTAEPVYGDLAEVHALQAVRELTEYFAGMRTVFDVPLHEHGTPFQKRVWAALRTIPCGETRSYGQIAAQIGNPRAARAVGMANNRNPIMIITPCHRVIGADGSLVGFGSGLSMKEYLLELEKRT